MIIGDKDKEGNTLILGGWKSNLFLTTENTYMIEKSVLSTEEEALELYNSLNNTKLLKLPPLPKTNTKTPGLEGLQLPHTQVRILGAFESESNPGVYHYVIESLKSNITCTCFGFRAPNHCWHHRSIMEIGPDNIKEPIVVKLKDLKGGKK